MSNIAPNGGTLCDANFNVPTHLQNNTITRRKCPMASRHTVEPHPLTVAYSFRVQIFR